VRGITGKEKRLWMTSALTYCPEIVDWLAVLLLVVDKGRTVRTSPGTLVTLIRMFPRVTSSVIYQIVRSLEFFPTEVTSVAKL